MISQHTLMRRISIVSVPTLLLAVTASWLVGLEGVFDPPFLIAALNFSFITLVSVYVAYLSARSYLESGLTTMALLGSGVLTYGVGLFLAGIAFASNLTIGVSIAVVAFLIAGALQTASSAMTWKRIGRYRNRRKLRLAVCYGGSVLVLCLVLFLFETGIVQAPFSVGESLQQVVLGLAVALFAISAVMTMAAYFRTRSPVLYWYSLALALVAIGILGFVVTGAVGDLVSWTGAISNYLGCLLFLQAIMHAKKPISA